MPSSSHLISCTPTKCNLYFANYLAIVVSEPDLYRLLTYQVPNLMSFFHCLVLTKVSVQVPRHLFMFCKKESFYCDEFSAPRPTPSFRTTPSRLSANDYSNIFAVTLHLGGHPSIRNVRTRHAVVTGTHLSLAL